ncbi:unnamed protein product [Brassica oleracea]
MHHFWISIQLWPRLWISKRTPSTPSFQRRRTWCLSEVMLCSQANSLTEEAKWIMETAQSFYLNDTRYKLLERFNKHTRDFEFKDVLQALDMPIL